ncbi:MAG: HlyD family efflux transporter periplasmic adaptor subunit [Legionella sp.]|uniref:HlyD family secretion protein n=1 Tax=Legionella sp. TaxID=459 RepID=UPI00283E25E9|nr:HlyD family efflux transporter periplasmic adaptor subunit [Legionella sp.]
MKANTYRVFLLTLLACLALVSCQNNKQVAFPGYIQGKFTYISAYYSGELTQLNVTAGDTIKQGQPLFTLEPSPENTELLAANARVQQARDEQKKHESNYSLQKKNHERNLFLFKKEVISKEELEKSNDDLTAAVANKKAAEANLLEEQAKQSQAQWSSKQKTVTAPVNALVFQTYYSEHEQVAANKPVLSLLTSGSSKVIFYVPEPLLSSIKLNQHVYVARDGQSETLKAKITYISPKEEYTPPVIFSDTERNKLVFRVEALPLTENNSAVHPGQPVTVLLDNTN